MSLTITIDLPDPAAARVRSAAEAAGVSVADYAASLLAAPSGPELAALVSERLIGRERFFDNLERFQEQYQHIEPAVLQALIDEAVTEIAVERRQRRDTPGASCP